MGWRREIYEGLRPVVDIVYPPRCPLCGDAIADQVGLCPACWNGIELPGSPACSDCNRPLGEGAARAKARCAVCIADPPRHAGIHAATLYNDTSRQLILAFKHGRKISLAPLLGRLMAGRLPQFAGESALLVPVPLHRWRILGRGFNQAALLARELERAGKGRLLVDGLVRHRRTPSLGGLGRLERETALAGAIRVRPSRAATIAGREIVLVDDVLTSGATSDACVEALLDAGASKVHIACFARVIERSGRRLQNITPEAMKTPGAT